MNNIGGELGFVGEEIKQVAEIKSSFSAKPKITRIVKELNTEFTKSIRYDIAFHLMREVERVKSERYA